MKSIKVNDLLSAAVHLLDNAEEHIARSEEDDGWVVTKEDFAELQRSVQKVRAKK